MAQVAQEVSFDLILEKVKSLTLFRQVRDQYTAELAGIPRNRDFLASKGISEEAEYKRLRGLIADYDTRIAETIRAVHEWFRFQEREVVQGLETDFATVGLGGRLELKRILQRVAEICETAQQLQKDFETKVAVLVENRWYLARETGESVETFQLPNSANLPPLALPGISREICHSCDLARIARYVAAQL